jgi:hypothetical protein
MRDEDKSEKRVVVLGAGFERGRNSLKIPNSRTEHLNAAANEQL